MDLKLLKDAPPWEWPEDAGKMFLEILKSDKADEYDRLLAAELAGDFIVINDELVNALLLILSNSDEPELLRGKAAISLGPVLEHADGKTAFGQVRRRRRAVVTSADDDDIESFFPTH